MNTDEKREGIGFEVSMYVVTGGVVFETGGERKNIEQV